MTTTGPAGTPTLLPVLRALPVGEWVTVEQLLARVEDATVNRDDTTVNGHQVTTVLAKLRRLGWVLRDRHGDEPTFKRTRTGDVEAGDPVRLRRVPTHVTATPAAKRPVGKSRPAA